MSDGLRVLSMPNPLEFMPFDEKLPDMMGTPSST